MVQVDAATNAAAPVRCARVDESEGERASKNEAALMAHCPKNGQNVVKAIIDFVRRPDAFGITPHSITSWDVMSVRPLWGHVLRPGAIIPRVVDQPIRVTKDTQKGV